MIAHLRPPILSLQGLRILIPRGGDLGAALHEKILDRGGVPTVAPLVATAPPRDPAAFAAAIERWNAGDYDWLVVTSATTAAALAAAGARPGGKVGAVGPVTAAAIQALGFRLHVMPGRDFSGRGLAESLLAALPYPGGTEGAVHDAGGGGGGGGGGAGAASAAAEPAEPAPSTESAASGSRGVRVFLPVSELADDTIERALRAAGHHVARVGAYTTAMTEEIPGLRSRAAAGDFDVVLATSSSAARAIAERLSPLPETTHIAAIGEPTARTLASLGLPTMIVADLSTTDGLLDACAVALVDGARETYEHTRQGETR